MSITTNSGASVYPTSGDVSTNLYTLILLILGISCRHIRLFRSRPWSSARHSPSSRVRLALAGIVTKILVSQSLVMESWWKRYRKKTGRLYGGDELVKGCGDCPAGIVKFRHLIDREIVLLSGSIGYAAQANLVMPSGQRLGRKTQSYDLSRKVLFSMKVRNGERL